MKRAMTKRTKATGHVNDGTCALPLCAVCEGAREKRTKAKRIEAWAAVFAETGSQCEQDSVFFEKESAAYVAKLYDARPTRAAHLVEADPLARLKEDVLRAARKVWRTAGLNTDPKWLRAVHDLEGAVERLERKRR